MSAFGGSRGTAPKPPEKGVFPLDHFGECTESMRAYLKCLKENNNRMEPCKALSKTYLECRMSRNLMAPQDLRELGFKEAGGDQEQSPVSPSKAPHQPKEEAQGFVAGLKRFK
ncbi:cytochrome c oxidase assembly protein COX19-like [Convolutriloba macropyga]|uniref:cytochrome c oxidase assembly protein COX19-like n=1 Tax=Convolutriloba macropyga TaxID=536237 RepID=UPI003F522F09